MKRYKTNLENIALHCAQRCSKEYGMECNPQCTLFKEFKLLNDFLDTTELIDLALMNGIYVKGSIFIKELMYIHRKVVLYYYQKELCLATVNYEQDEILHRYKLSNYGIDWWLEKPENKNEKGEYNE